MPNVAVSDSYQNLTFRPYIGYTANLTQNRVQTTSGLLVVGKTYVVVARLGSDDFSNVGYIAEGSQFVATGTTPAVWTNSSIVINATDSAPQTVVLENSLGAGDWVWNNKGAYQLDTTVVFDNNKNYCAPFSDWGDIGTTAIPLLGGSNTVEGYYIIQMRNNGGFLTLKIDVFNSSGAANTVDLSDIIGTSQVSLPEIRVYP